VGPLLSSGSAVSQQVFRHTPTPWSQQASFPRTNYCSSPHMRRFRALTTQRKKWIDLIHECRVQRKKTRPKPRVRSRQLCFVNNMVRFSNMASNVTILQMIKWQECGTKILWPISTIVGIFYQVGQFRTEIQTCNFLNTTQECLLSHCDVSQEPFEHAVTLINKCDAWWHTSLSSGRNM
jgi:hypothetical protein